MRKSTVGNRNFTKQTQNKENYDIYGWRRPEQRIAQKRNVNDLKEIAQKVSEEKRARQLLYGKEKRTHPQPVKLVKSAQRSRGSSSKPVRYGGGGDRQLHLVRRQLCKAFDEASTTEPQKSPSFPSSRFCHGMPRECKSLRLASRQAFGNLDPNKPQEDSRIGNYTNKRLENIMSDIEDAASEDSTLNLLDMSEVDRDLNMKNYVVYVAPDTDTAPHVSETKVPVKSNEVNLKPNKSNAEPYKVPQLVLKDILARREPVVSTPKEPEYKSEFLRNRKSVVPVRSARKPPVDEWSRTRFLRKSYFHDPKETSVQENEEKPTGHSTMVENLPSVASGSTFAPSFTSRYKYMNLHKASSNVESKKSFTSVGVQVELGPTTSNINQLCEIMKELEEFETQKCKLMQHVFRSFEEMCGKHAVDKEKSDETLKADNKGMDSPSVAAGKPQSIVTSDAAYTAMKSDFKFLSTPVSCSLAEVDGRNKDLTATQMQLRSLSRRLQRSLGKLYNNDESPQE